MTGKSHTKSLIRKLKRFSLPSLRFTTKALTQNIHSQKLSIMLIKIETFRGIMNAAYQIALTDSSKLQCWNSEVRMKYNIQREIVMITDILAI